jgi:hypothetical protein
MKKLIIFVTLSLISTLVFCQGSITLSPNNTSIDAQTNQPLIFSTNSFERMRISSSGNVGIGQTNPSYKLDMLHGGSTGLRVKSSSGFSVVDIDAFNGDAAIRFADNGTNQWIIRNVPASNNFQIFELGGGSRFLIQNFTGNVGIGTETPSRLLHISQGASGLTPHSNAKVFIEDDANTYLNIGTPDANESGILFGKPSFGATSGGIIYTSARDMQFRTSTNDTRMVVTEAGNVGIGTTAPSAKLHIAGSAKIGTNGTVISEIIKVTVSVPAFTIGANSCENQNISVTNAAVGSAVMASPDIGITEGLFIAYSRVSSAGTVRIRICNFKGVSITQNTSDFHVAVVK